MHRPLASVAFALLAVTVVTPFIAQAQVGAETTQFGTGCHAITAEEQAGLQAMGATIPANGQFCDKDKPLLNGGCSESPYPYLQTKNKTGRPDSVSGLNSDFACRMMKFLKAADAAGMNIAIGSGYRSVAQQTGMYNAYIAGGKSGAPVAPPGRSKHNFGLAIDLNYNGTIGPRNTAQCVATLPPCRWAHSNEAQFGLRWPMEYEPWHIEPSGTVNGKQQPLPEGGWTGDQNPTPYTNTGAPYNPSTWQPQMAPQPQQYSPLGSTGVPTQTQSTQTGTQTTTNPYTNTTTPVPNTSTNTYAIPSLYTYPYSTSTNASSSSSIQNQYQQIQLLANGSTTTSYQNQSYATSTSTPTQLNRDLNDIQSNGDTGGTSYNDAVLAVADTHNNVPNNTVSSSSVVVPQTGVTNTFSNNTTVIPPIATSTTDANRSLIVALLTTLRDFLLSYLHALQNRGAYGFQAAWQIPSAQ